MKEAEVLRIRDQARSDMKHFFQRLEIIEASGNYKLRQQFNGGESAFMEKLRAAREEISMNVYRAFTIFAFVKSDKHICRKAEELFKAIMELAEKTPEEESGTDLPGPSGVVEEKESGGIKITRVQPRRPNRRQRRAASRS